MSEHLILAGIAAKDEAVLRKKLEQNGLRKGDTINFLTVPENEPFYKTKVIEQFLASLANTVAKRRPEYLRLIYIPYRNHEILVENFFPFADIQTFDNQRTYHDYVLNNFSGIEAFANELLKIVKNGLKIGRRPSRRHYILLPNHNFLIEDKSFYTLLHEFYFDGNLNQGIFSCIKENKTLHCYEDSRNLAFPVTKINEGKLRFDETNKILPKHFLSGIYRLGILWDEGLHFDVRHNTKATLNGLKFNCSLNGEVCCAKATHLNIYLNDFIRIPPK